MVPVGVADVSPWAEWLSAAEGSLRFLHEYVVGWDVWVVTQTEAGRQIVLRSSPPGAVSPGTELPWARSLCRQMIEGIAPRVSTTSLTAGTARGPGSGIAAYVGVPLITGDLRVFGTLSGIAFREQPRSAARELPLVEQMARLLNTLLACDLPGPTARELPGAPRVAR